MSFDRLATRMESEETCWRFQGWLPDAGEGTHSAFRFPVPPRLLISFSQIKLHLFCVLSSSVMLVLILPARKLGCERLQTFHRMKMWIWKTSDIYSVETGVWQTPDFHTRLTGLGNCAQAARNRKSAWIRKILFQQGKIMASSQFTESRDTPPRTPALFMIKK